MVELLAACLLLLQDRADADRVRMANAFEVAVRAHGLPKKADGTWRAYPVFKDEVLRSFAAKHAPENGAVLVASSSGTLWALAGGRRGDEGVPVAFYGRREGILFVSGGPTKIAGGSAEAVVADSPKNLFRGILAMGDKFYVRIARGTSPRAVQTPSADGDGDGGSGAEKSDIEPAVRDPIRGIETLGQAVEDAAVEWKRADADGRRRMAAKLARDHRPDAGVLACINKAGDFLVVIGADGSAAQPDGVGVEVSGRVKATIVLIPGRAKGDGKPGAARGAGAFVLEPK